MASQGSASPGGDSTPRPDPVVVPACDAAPPSVTSLAPLVAVDPFTLSASARVELLADLERHTAWLDAVKAEAMVAVAGPGPDYDCSDDPVAGADLDSWHDLASADESVCAEVSASLRISSGAAQHRITVARDLHYKLPQTRQLLSQGICSYAQAHAVAQECEHLSIADARVVESQALSRVATQNPGQTRRSVRRAIARICPPEPAVELEREFARREVSMHSDGGVMATITATLPAPDAIAVWNALTGCANRDVHESDTRTKAHRRADALTAWAHRELESPDFPRMQGKKRLETQVVIGFDTLMGLDDEPGELVGFGPIPAVLARQLASESSAWRRLITDSVTGYLLDYGTNTYTPPALLREYVIARDRTCQFPGCSQPGWRCDLDHSVPFTGHETGGSTSAANLVTLCRRHHQLKTHHRWRYRIAGNGGAVSQRPVDAPDTSVPVSSTESGSSAGAATPVGPSNAAPSSIVPNSAVPNSAVPNSVIEWTSPRGRTYRVELTRQLDPRPEASEEAAEAFAKQRGEELGDSVALNSDADSPDDSNLEDQGSASVTRLSEPEAHLAGQSSEAATALEATLTSLLAAA